MPTVPSKRPSFSPNHQRGGWAFQCPRRTRTIKKRNKSSYLLVPAGCWPERVWAAWEASPSSSIRPSTFQSAQHSIFSFFYAVDRRTGDSHASVCWLHAQERSKCVPCSFRCRTTSLRSAISSFDREFQIEEGVPARAYVLLIVLRS